jgi:hypothetical protein
MEIKPIYFIIEMSGQIFVRESGVKMKKFIAVFLIALTILTSINLNYYKKTAKADTFDAFSDAQKLIIEALLISAGAMYNTYQDIKTTMSCFDDYCSKTATDIGLFLVETGLDGYIVGKSLIEKINGFINSVKANNGVYISADGTKTYTGIATGSITVATLPGSDCSFYINKKFLSDGFTIGIANSYSGVTNYPAVAGEKTLKYTYGGGTASLQGAGNVNGSSDYFVNGGISLNIIKVSGTSSDYTISFPDMGENLNDVIGGAGELSDDWADDIVYPKTGVTDNVLVGTDTNIGNAFTSSIKVFNVVKKSFKLVVTKSYTLVILPNKSCIQVINQTTPLSYVLFFLILLSWLPFVLLQ